MLNSGLSVSLANDGDPGSWDPCRRNREPLIAEVKIMQYVFSLLTVMGECPMHCLPGLMLWRMGQGDQQQLWCCWFAAC